MPSIINHILNIILHFSQPVHKGIKATHYSNSFENREMANGKKFHQYFFTVASNEYPLGTTLRIMNIKNHRIVYATVTDREAERKSGQIDLSNAAYDELRLSRKKGWGWVTVNVVS